MPAASAARIPVYLLTGFLGSGKTTLLSAWLKQEPLRGAAVIVNELGEVGLDGALLGVADGTALLSGTCVCCTGLPGLEQALEDLFWARLQRRMPAFPAVAIETTGLADPAPVVQAFQSHPVLRERYRLRAVVTVAGAAAGAALIDRHAEARAQVRAAQALVMTKTGETSLAQVRELAARLAALNPHAPVLTSNHADLALDTVLAAVGGVGDGLRRGHDSAHGAGGTGPHSDPEGAHGDGHGHVREASDAHEPAHAHDHPHVHEHPHADEHPHTHEHQHAAQACFLPLPQPVTRDWLLIRLHALAGALADDLLRLKGMVTLADGSRAVVQFAPDEARFDLRPAELPEAAAPAAGEAGQASGLTVIALHADAGRVAQAFFGNAAA